MSLEAKVLKWVFTGETGASSKCLAAHLTGNKCDGSYPHDSGDFGRCVGLLKAAPELRALLPRMAKVNSYWRALVAEWDRIEVLDGHAMQSKAIHAVIRPIEDADGRVIRMRDNATILFGTIKP